MNIQLQYIINLIEKRYTGINIEKEIDSLRIYFHNHLDKVAKKKKAEEFYLENQKKPFDLEIFSDEEGIRISSALKDFRYTDDYNELTAHLELIKVAHPCLSDEITYEDDSWVIYCSTELSKDANEREIEDRLDLMLNWIIGYQNWK